MSKLSIQSINSLVKSASYAVRGRIVTKSIELSNQLKLSDSNSNLKLPFNEIIFCNIGNPQSLEQQPLTFIRDVLSLVLNPSLQFRLHFPYDVLQRAKYYLSSIPSMGAYTESQGMLAVRQDISKFLEQRDHGYPSNPNDIFLTNGASDGVRLCMQTFLREPQSGFKDGILAPIPQYPIYSALTTLLAGHLVPYYLDESNNWGCNISILNTSLQLAKEQGICIRVLVIINPGNPTGQILNEESMKEIINFCSINEICIMADEVYQENIWKEGIKFISFRKVVYDMMKENPDLNVQMVSFHSISKGYFGECGLRGGYFEIFGIPADVKAELYKLASISLCSNTVGQIVTGLMVQPPVEGDESYPLYIKEKEEILSSLQRRAELLSDALNNLEGIHCNAIDGALYAFPTIILPDKAIEEAKTLGYVAADEMYCMQLVEQTGIVLVPGSGFGQYPGSNHFRITILPPEDKIHDVIQLLSVFHNNFLAKYK